MKDHGLNTVEPQVCPYCMTVIENQEGKKDCSCGHWDDGKFSCPVSYWFLRLFDRELPAFPVLGSKVKMKDIMLLRPADVLFVFENQTVDNILAMHSPSYASDLERYNNPKKCA